MKKFIKINENEFKLKEVDFSDPQSPDLDKWSARNGEKTSDTPFDKLDSNSDLQKIPKQPPEQAKLAIEQFNNFIQYLSDYPDDSKISRVLMDMIIMCKEIKHGRKITTY